MKNQFKNTKGQTESEFLSQYNAGDYEKPSVTVDMLLFTVDKSNEEPNLKILLIKRKDHPFINCWAVPGGFVNINEGLDVAAYRELKEETNITDNVYLEQLYTFGNNVNRDSRMRVITVSYMSLTSPDNIKKTSAGDDASNALWFNVKKKKTYQDEEKTISLMTLLNEENNIKIEYEVKSYLLNGKVTEEITPALNCENLLAFDHNESINLAIDRMRNKVDYTPIAFNLLPKEFTLLELQDIYEVLLDTKLEKSNFRKRIMHMVSKTNKNNKGEVNYRPAQYYTFNPFYKNN